MKTIKTTIRPVSLLLLSLAFAFPATCAVAADQSSSTQSTRASDQSSSDRNMDAVVLARLHRTNLHEIAAGTLAKQKGHTADVRDYGQTLVSDHEQADKRVLDLAHRKGLSLAAPNPDTAHEEKQREKKTDEMAKLSSASGADFDRQFLDAMEKGHKKAVAMLRDCESKVQDPEVKQLVQDLIPKLEHHRDLAQNAEHDLASASPTTGASE